MTQEEIDKLIEKIKGLTGDARKGAIEAIERVFAGRNKQKGKKPNPPIKDDDIDDDPDLDLPEDDPSELEDPSDIDIEDPDHVLKSKEEEEEEESHESSDDDYDDPSDDDSGKSDDYVSDMPEDADNYKTSSQKENEQREHMRKASTVARTRKVLDKALEKASAGELSEEEVKALEAANEILKELEKIKDSGKLDDLDAEKFDDKINSILDAVDRALDLHYSEDTKSRLRKFKDDMSDPIAKTELDNEDQVNATADPSYQKIKAREAEKERYAKIQSAGLSGGVAAFKKDLLKAITDQIEDIIDEHEDTTYALPDRHHELDDITTPATRIDDITLPKEERPKVNVYFDQSGSWTADDVKKGMSAIADILSLEKEELLTVDIKYFSQILSADREAARAKGSMECWDLSVQDIMAEPKANNVIIMTDRDITHDWRYPGCHGCFKNPEVTVDGYVWFLWKNGNMVSEAPTKLNGKRGTSSYSI